ncbi:MAG: N-acetyl-gamma-glutamyl-phosphate reductase [Alphaproteobacteria bacterium]
MSLNKLNVSIVGITGYTGLELLRLLIAHPQINIVHLTSRQHDNAPIGEVFPHLAAQDMMITNPPLKTVARDSDIVFLCLPHKTAQDTVAELYGKTRIIDLSADFRLNDAHIYEKYYGLKHNHTDLLKKSVYGAPEFYRHKIKKADLVANPGCFALLCQFMLYPFADNIEKADIFAVTGSSGSGKKVSDGTHHPIRSHNVKSYNINKHRHIPEIIRTIGMEESQLNFVPTSGPFTRGIFASAFIKLQPSAPPLLNPPSAGGSKEEAHFSSCGGGFYSQEPFIRVVDEVALANIVGSNYCDLSYAQGHDDTIIVQGALDNLVKGAAGCAVQNMNLMFGIEETMGLDIFSPLYP